MRNGKHKIDCISIETLRSHNSFRIKIDIRMKVVHNIIETIVRSIEEGVRLMEIHM